MNNKGVQDDLFGLVKVFVEAGILEKTRFAGYIVAIDVLALKREVDLLQRKVASLEEKLDNLNK